ncbi:hypothetical protein OHA37_22205 [Streptomyces sp. NBC_00335]|uniref:hypothetical protein n=1 Tax=unclassified Streptomyces TaxID=2593676 RepID=UPI0022546958|nr:MULTISPECIES: hypothetical protein [unclassified Streptomyces]MCX5406574.1 hypothetical protein [Streptomyces sp. NBC_00086]
MNSRRRSPSDLGLELWDLVKDAGEDGMPRETALDHMTPSQFEVAKVWDRDNMCEKEHECFLYVLGQYLISRDPQMSVLALNREIELLYRRAVRLHRSAIAPLGEGGRLSPQLRVAHTALAGMIEAAAPLRHAGFSAAVVVRSGGGP